MIDDLELSRRLTAALRGVSGVSDVYAARPILGVAAAVMDAAATLAGPLELHMPDVLVDIARADGFTTISAHIATSASRPAPDVLRAAGETLRDLVAPELPTGSQLAVNVRVRFVDDADAFE